jgi:hypothetical protein
MTEGPVEPPSHPAIGEAGPDGEPRGPEPGPPAAGPAPYPPYGATPGGPFAPRVREPWINPAKRRSAGWLAAALAALLLGAGVLIGIAVAPGHARGGDRFGPAGRGMVERHMIERRIERQLRRHLRGGPHAHRPAPSPLPTSSHR